MAYSDPDPYNPYYSGYRLTTGATTTPYWYPNQATTGTHLRARIYTQDEWLKALPDPPVQERPKPKPADPVEWLKAQVDSYLWEPQAA